MKLQFLGTGGFHPNDRRHTACVLVPELGIAFDAGTSTFRLPSRLQTPDLTIFLSHAHLDHICGLTYLLVPLLEETIRTCTVYGPPAAIEAVETHLFTESIFPIRPRFELAPIPERMQIGGGVLTWHALHHPGGSIGYRFDAANGKSFAYFTDTTANNDSASFLRGVDVLIHECYYPDRLAQWCEPTGHSHASQVAQLACEAQVGRLYLTHIDPQQPGDDPIGIADARRIFPDTFYAEDLLEIEI